MSFKINCEDILKGISEFEIKSKIAVDIYADTAAKKLEAKAKQDASWIDRTGLTRKTIEGGKQWQGDKCNVYVAGNTEQMPYLELAHDKKYATLKPSVENLSGEILRGMVNLLGK